MGSNKKKTYKHHSAFHAAEVMSHDLSLLRGKKNSVYFDDSELLGLLSAEEVEKEVQQLKKVDVDSYIQRVVSPSESKNRQSAPEVIQQLGGKMIVEETEGPLYSAEIEISISGRIFADLVLLLKITKFKMAPGLQITTAKQQKRCGFLHHTVSP